MANWIRTNSDPITTDSFLSVENERGERGRISIRQPTPGIVSFFGCVYAVEIKRDSEGTPISETRTVLDTSPTVDGITVI